MYVPTVKSDKVQSVDTITGGKVTLTETAGGKMTMTVNKGYKETPEERKERLAMSKRGGAHKSKKVYTRKDKYGKKNWN